jgi:hypothetical protein
MHRALSLLAVAALSLSITPAAALASSGPACDESDWQCPRGERSDAAVVFGATHVDTTRAVGGSSAPVSGGVSVCSFESVWEGFDRHRDIVDESGIPLPARFYRMVCGGTGFLRWYVPGESDPVADGVLTEIVQEAFDRIDARLPGWRLTPDVGGVHLTGLATFLAVDADDWATLVGEVEAGPLRVRAWLEPVETNWTLDGATQVCSGPGSVYDPTQTLAQQDTACVHTFTQTEGGDVAVSVVYRAGYEVSGVEGLEGSFELGVVEGPEITASLDVREIRAVRVAP